MSDPDTSKRRFPLSLAIAILPAGPISGLVTGLGYGFTIGSDMIFTQELQDYTIVPASPQHIASMIAFFIFGGAFVGLTHGTLAMIILGMPMHTLLLRKTAARLWIYALAGSAAGALFVLLFAFQSVVIGSPALWYFASTVLLGAGTGMIAASVFWLIRRPDRDATASAPPPAAAPAHRPHGQAGDT